MRIRAFVFSLILAVPCAFSIWKGIELIGFSLLSARADEFSVTRKQNDADNARSLAIARNLAGWSGVAGVRYEAMARIVALKSVSGPPIEFEGVKPDVIALLSMRPLAGNFWMFLADGDLLSGEPAGHVLALFEMAERTMPREGVNMSRRVDFGFRIWEFLPDEMRERVAADFGGVRPLLRAQQLQRFKTIIAGKLDDVRSDMRAKLQARAGIDAASFAQIGL